MSSPSRAISLSSESDSDGHPADTLIVQKARQVAAVREAAEHRKKKRRRTEQTSQPSATAPSPAHAEADDIPAQPSNTSRKKRKKTESSSRPSSGSPQLEPLPEQQEEAAPKQKKRRRKRAEATTEAVAAQSAGSREPAEVLERLARDAPDGAVLAAVEVSGSDSETDADVQIVGVGRSWEEGAAHLAANGAARGPSATLTPPPGLEMSRLGEHPTSDGAKAAQAALGGSLANGAAGMSTPRPAAPIGVTVIGDDEAVTVNSELQRLLRVPRYFDEDFEGSASRCFKCGGSGHVARECTEEGKAKPCYLCAQFGHSSMDCPARLCFRCRRPGHIARDCPTSYSDRAMEQAQPVCLRCGRAECPGVTDSVRASGGCTGEYAKADLAAVRCYACGRKGHLCCAKVPASTYRPSCYNCGEGGHTADECRRERPPLVRNEQQPALNQSAWDYGRGHNSGGADDYRGSRGYDSGNTARWNGGTQWDSPDSGQRWQHDRYGFSDGKTAARQRSYARYHDQR